MGRIVAVVLLGLLSFSTGTNAQTAKFLKSNRIETTQAPQVVASTTEQTKSVTEAPTAPETPQPVAAPEPVVAAAPVAEPAYVAPAPVVADAGSAKMFIYNHESGNNPASVNSSGCRGLGQACPGSKLPCDADYACQDAWFTNYMQGRYGTWENAKAFWLAHNWW